MPKISIIIITVLCSLIIFSFSMSMYYSITEPPFESKEIKPPTKYEVSLYNGGVLISRDTLDTFKEAWTQYINPKNGKKIRHNLNYIIKEL